MATWISGTINDWRDPFERERAETRARLRVTQRDWALREIRVYARSGAMMIYAAFRAEFTVLWVVIAAFYALLRVVLGMFEIWSTMPEIKEKIRPYAPPSDSKLRETVRNQVSGPPIGLVLIICWLYAWRPLFLS